MTKFFKILFMVSLLLASASSIADTFTIRPTSTINPKNIKSQKTTTLQGKLEIIPLMGAMWTIQSREFGQVLLFRPWEIPETVSNKLDMLEKQGNLVNITGNLLLLCSTRDLNSGMVGCRQFDSRQKIKIEVLSWR